MSILEFIVGIVEAIVWPGTALMILYMLRTPIGSVLPMIEQLRYKEFAVSFRNDAKNALNSLETEQILDQNSVEQTKRIYDPKLAVFDAWNQLERTAHTKLIELKPKKDMTNLDFDRVLGYFEYSGALIPRVKQALSELRNLRNRAAHLPKSAISEEGARNYVRLAAAVEKQIVALSALPNLRLNRLIYLIFEYNHLLDTGNYQHISINDVHREIESGKILRYIRDIGGQEIDLSLILDSKSESEFESKYVEHLQSIYGGNAGRERRKWGVVNNGICLLIAWTCEIIQQGSGWHPDETIA